MGWTYKRIRPLDSWTFDECLNEALKHNSKNEWLKASNGTYRAARKNGWYEECTKHMTNITTPSYLAKERCIEEAKKYNTIKDWRINSGGAMCAAKKNNWYEECIAHMVRYKKNN